MEWPEPLRQDLPPEHIGEPSPLRGDILDEIGDHLACAVERERAAGLTEPEARRAVLRRFGNPAEIIRMIWFESMKERIMRMKVLVSINIFAFCFVLVPIGMLTLDSGFKLFNPWNTMGGFITGSDFWPISLPILLAAIILGVNIFTQLSWIRNQNCCPASKIDGDGKRSKDDCKI